jgi:ABC-type dipeptide/oligopeptide/nickel transport system ATPase subunit
MNRADSNLPLLQWTCDVSKPKHPLSPFTIYSSDRIFISGPSGSGKTSFFKRLVVLNPDFEDTIIFQGEKLVPSNITSFRRACLWLPQHPPRSDEALISWLKRRSKRLEADEMTALNRFKSELRKLLLWSETELELNLSKKLTEFSGGELQAITLCTAVCVKPKILILDESTSAMDSKLESRFWNWISESKKSENTELAILWTSHHPRPEIVSQLGFRCLEIPKKNR